LVTEVAGNYRLEVRSDDKEAKTGKYTTEIKELRAAIDTIA